MYIFNPQKCFEITFALIEFYPNEIDMYCFSLSMHRFTHILKYVYAIVYLSIPIR